MLLMVSQHGHCLNDLLFRWKFGPARGRDPGHRLNHPDFADLAASYGIPFHHLPLPASADAEAKRAQGGRSRRSSSASRSIWSCWRATCRS